MNLSESELVSKCRALYEAMEGASQTTPENMVIWIGPLTTLLSQVTADGASANYGQVVGALTDMGCIENIRKGGGKTQSIWRLNYPPTMDLSNRISRTRNNPKSTKAEATQAQLNDISRRLSIVEHDLRTLINYVNKEYQAKIESAEGVFGE